MDTGSADHTARNGEPVHMSRSGSTRPFAPDSPMAKKLKKKEQEMLTNWPTADEDPNEEIPPTEPRPTQLNFESANAAPFENIANKPTTIASASANDTHDHKHNAPAHSSASTTIRRTHRLRNRTQDTELPANIDHKQRTEPGHNH